MKKKGGLREGAYDDDAFYRKQHEKQDRDRFGHQSAEEARRKMIRRQSFNDPETGYPWGKVKGG